MITEPAKTLTVLIIDEEHTTRRYLHISLEANGYRVYEATAGMDGLSKAAMLNPDAVLLALDLPDIAGLDLLKALREWSTVPVIILSVRNLDTEKIELFDAGADDYLTKPFSIGELMARLRLAQRHRKQSTNETSIFQSGPLTVDLMRRLVTINDQLVKLTPTEYTLLRLLLHDAGRVVTNRQLLHEIWGPGYETKLHYLRVYVAQLRHKIEADPTHPALLITEPGIGYRLILDLSVDQDKR